jgi:hypothetical protein
LIVCSAVSGAATKSSGEAPENPWVVIGCTERTGIPIPVSTSESTAYLSAFFAIIVERIECDGTTLKPETGVILHLRDDDWRQIKGGKLVYILPFKFLTSVVKFDPTTGSYAAVQYFIPSGTKKIKISYRVRYPTGSASMGMTLEAEVTPSGP